MCWFSIVFPPEQCWFGLRAKMPRNTAFQQKAVFSFGGVCTHKLPRRWIWVGASVDCALPLCSHVTYLVGAANGHSVTFLTVDNFQ